MVAAQGLDRRPRRAPTKTDVLDVIRRMGALQIDTIHVVARSPYLVLWSRLGDYEPRWLEDLLAEGQLFEYWAHEACFLPIEDYALFRHRMIDPGSLGWKYSHEWVEKNREQVDHVLDTIRQRGPARSADFERRDGKSGGWWGWKPEKRALEMLFSAGELMVARRERFQRVYDLRERVHTAWDDAQLPSVAQAQRTLMLRSIQALGIVTARRVPDYYRLPKQSAALVPELAREGVVFAVQVDGWKEPGYVHTENRELFENAAAGELRFPLTTFLSPFDPLIWDRARAKQVFDFEYSLECYTPAPKRKFGYYVLPILRRGRLVGRMDAKAVRADEVFEVRRLALEENARYGAALVSDIAAALREIAEWHGTPEISLGRVEPAAFARDLRRALGARRKTHAGARTSRGGKMP
jgi:uncharacterized protein YcaQ